jgi:serine/threonine-protein kinase
MGSVWEGIHITLGNRVAVKFIETDYAESDEARTRFENEARAAARLRSKYVVQVYDYGVMPDGRPFIVMEYLAGESLDARLARLGRLNIEDTTRIITQVSRALAKAHSAGIVHRDLKPENVFLVNDEEEASDIAKVVDFGIAKFTDTSMGVSSSTRTGSVLGTPYYMSPEQARGLRTVDFRSDLWSLGVIAFKCLTGRYPFEGEAIGDLLVKICTAPLPTPSSYAAMPQGFDTWFEKALQRDPAQRFASATDLADQLARSCGTEGTRALQPLVPHDTSAQAGAGEAVAVRGARYDTSMPLSRTLEHASLNRRSGLALAAVAAVVFLVGTFGGIWWLLSRKSEPEHAASAAPSVTPVEFKGLESAKLTSPSAVPVVAQPTAAVEAKVSTAASITGQVGQPALTSASRGPAMQVRQPSQQRPARGVPSGSSVKPGGPKNAPADLGY